MPLSVQQQRPDSVPRGPDPTIPNRPRPDPTSPPRLQQLPSLLHLPDVTPDLHWSFLPKKKFKKVQVHVLVTSSFSSSRSTDEAKDLDDTSTGPSLTNDPDNAGAPPAPTR
ncbi:uncharacterized protein LOC123427702 isoform X4 [Hordeum vulgare subsp. vulgare]|uniref:uncharacterized protein LOC123427702 isoform X4 n=1 Tax=Hordeum vulgare subsp. vulgare TaxID=112509 RepID=UPI001D1A3AC4|nr:uncharacterized protein LOC123427702 isoform X4 [Hordeum vulgare subsp. vulgare]